jgi:hypothetical protein
MDGTQEPPPPPLLPDPLAGLVTGDFLTGQELWVPRVVVPEPPKLPDPTEIREALDAVLREKPRRRPPMTPRVTPPTQRAPRQWPAARALRATRDRPPALVPEQRPTGMRSGISVVIVILLVTAVILFYVFRSLAQTFTQLFG